MGFAMGGASMKTDGDGVSVFAAILGAVVSFGLAFSAIFYKVADVRVNGILHGGPTSLAAAMAGLFGGGVVALAVLVFLLRWGNSLDRSIDG
jgi:hypothetical protein